MAFLIQEEEGECGEEGFVPPKLGCLDSEKWDYAIGDVSRRIFWDRDWELEGVLFGIPDPKGAERRFHLDIFRASGMQRLLQAGIPVIDVLDSANITRVYFQPYKKRAGGGAFERLLKLVAPYAA